MIELNNLTIRLISDERVIVSSLNFTLEAGDKCAIIGEEGNGKSTLLKLIYDKSLVQGYCEYEGVITHRSPRIGYLAQELGTELAGMRICDYFAEIEDYGLLAQALANFRLDFELIYSEKTMGQLSGGENVKLRLAKLLCEAPGVLLLDEPTNDIDIRTLIWMEEFINGLKIPVLYVSHDETLIENTANVILHLEQVRKKTTPRHTIERVGYSEYVSKRLYLLGKQEQIARKQKSEHRAKEARWQQLFEKVQHQQSAISRQDPAGGRLLKKKMKSIKSQEKRLDREAEDMVQLPDYEDAIDFSFSSEVTIPKAKTVLDIAIDCLSIGDKALSENVKLTVVGNSHIGIIGSNGVGKTTLLQLIWEQLAGRTDIKAGYMPQNYANKLDETLTPVEFLYPRATKEDLTRARTTMGAVRFTHEEMEGKISALSGGQRAKLLFIDMILKEYNVLVLDEPTRNFSPLSNPVIRSILREYGGAIISVSHDRKYLDEVCDAVYELRADGLFLV